MVIAWSLEVVISYYFPIVKKYVSRKLSQDGCNSPPINLNGTQHIPSSSGPSEQGGIFYKSTNLGLLPDNLKEKICSTESCSSHPGAHVNLIVSIFKASRNYSLDIGFNMGEAVNINAERNNHDFYHKGSKHSSPIFKFNSSLLQLQILKAVFKESDSLVQDSKTNDTITYSSYSQNDCTHGTGGTSTDYILYS